jgi:hypothetical protein
MSGRIGSGVVTGGYEERKYLGAVAFVSLPYWFVVVPWWVSRRRRAE